eukprot:TRINITY_DN25073_c0_g1_i1.p1 TRINITY_DN25073_c0_g1~~TRINITY_DN25073_c0_g1_i1.p1  ORF type:complete len:221 (-),score=30.54 TRINITY_DN25073_c0_g1_i1:377-1039(-)
MSVATWNHDYCKVNQGSSLLHAIAPFVCSWASDEEDAAHMEKTISGSSSSTQSLYAASDVRSVTTADLGSSSRQSSTSSIWGYVPQLEEDYPSDVVVRKTFIDVMTEDRDLQAVRRTRSEEPVARRPVGVERPTRIRSAGNAVSPNIEAMGTPLQNGDLLGSSQMPTIGSAQHGTGNCRPCAFFWKDSSCLNGVNCYYCHLCGPLEKKRRQKMKRGALKP